MLKAWDSRAKSGLRCIQFDGTPDSICYGNYFSFTTSNYKPLSFSLWYKLAEPSTTTYSCPVSLYATSNVGVECVLRYINDGIFANALTQGKLQTYDETFDFNDHVNEWHHLSYCFSETTQRVYIDGILKKEGYIGGWLIRNSNLRFVIGGRDGGGDCALKSQMANLNVYERDLSQSEISELAKSIYNIPKDSDHQFIFSQNDCSDTGISHNWNCLNGNNVTFSNV